MSKTANTHENNSLERFKLRLEYPGESQKKLGRGAYETIKDLIIKLWKKRR